MSVSERDPAAHPELKRTMDVAEEILEEYGGDTYAATIGSLRKGQIAVLRDNLEPIEKAVIQTFEADPRVFTQADAGAQIMHVQLDDSQQTLGADP